MKKRKNIFLYIVLSALALLFLVPIILVVINSFKSRLYISSSPFSLPNSETFVGLENYINGIASSGFFSAVLRPFFITVVSVALIRLNKTVSCRPNCKYVHNINTNTENKISFFIMQILKKKCT